LVIGVVIAMFTVILPNFLSAFEGMELPPLTKFLMAVSGFMTQHTLALIGIIVGTIVTIVVLLRVKAVKVKVNKVILHLPKIGGLLSTIYTARFARTLSSLYTSGLPMIQSLEISSKTVGSAYIESQFEESVKAVKDGAKLSEALAMIKGFDSKLMDSIMVGEESGALETMLVSMADTFDYEAEMATAGIIAVAEPVLIIVIAGVVGVIAIGVLSPLMSIYSNVNNM
jgi:type IV pilus assembly protein PilC